MATRLVLSLLLAVLFFACQSETTAPQDQLSAGDADLIQAIAADPGKQSIDLDQLPPLSQYTLKEDYSDSYVDGADFSAERGYEVTIRKEWGTHIGEATPVYFDLDGRELRGAGSSVDSRVFNRDGHEQTQCFMLVYPVTFIMPDGSTLAGDDAKAICTAIKEWYEANPDSKERPALQYPVEVTLSDGSTMTINNADEMQALKQDCKDGEGDYDRNRERDGDHASCFKLVYPVTVIMPDSSEITLADSTGWDDVKSWYEANPDSKKRPVFQYPLDVVLNDGSTMTVNNADELHALKEDCKDGEGDYDREHEKDHTPCFKLVYPLTVIMPDSSEISLADSTGWADVKSWYEANPDSKERPALKYPLDVTLKDGSTMTINSAEELYALKKDCQDWDDDHDGHHEGDRHGDGDGDGHEHGDDG